MPKTQPTLIRIGSKGAYVNLNNTVSIGIVKDQVHNKLKDDWAPTAEQKEPEGKDYEAFKADTLSFYFIGRDELILRVGSEITDEEFEASSKIINEITYMSKDERITVSNKAS